MYMIIDGENVGCHENICEEKRNIGSFLLPNSSLWNECLPYFRKCVQICKSLAVSMISGDTRVKIIAFGFILVFSLPSTIHLSDVKAAP